MLKKMLKQRNKKGFTLIELIVVLVIMAILAAAAIPAMMGYVNKAKKASYLANCRAVYVAAQANITEQLGTGSGTIATTGTMDKAISAMVPDIAEGDIVFDAAAKGKYYVKLATGNKSVESVTYQFGDAAADTVVLTPGDETNGTNVMS